MADVNKSISIQYTADTGKLEKALKRIPNITDKEARQAVSDLDKNFRRMEKSADKTAKNVKTSMSTMKKSFAEVGLAVGAVAGGTVLMIQKIADATNEIVDASAKTGIAVETLAGLRLAAEGSGLQFANLEAGLIKFQQSMNNAGRGSKQLAETFETLGVNVKDNEGNLRDADSVFNEVIDSLGQMGNETERNAAAMLIFGQRAGPGLIQSGALENLDQMRVLATEFGIAVNEDAIGAMANFQRAMANFNNVAMGVMSNLINSIAGKNGASIMIDTLTKTFIYLGSIGGDVIAALAQGFEKFFGFIQAGYLFMNGQQERAIYLIEELDRESSKVGANFFNMFERANAQVEKFNANNQNSPAPRVMENVSEEAKEAGQSIEGAARSTKKLSSAMEEIQPEHLEIDVTAWKTLSKIGKDIDSDLVTPLDKVDERFRKINSRLETTFLEAEEQLENLLSVPVESRTEEDLEGIMRMREIMSEAEKLMHDNNMRYERDLHKIREENHRSEMDRIQAEFEERQARQQEIIDNIETYGNQTLQTFNAISTAITDLNQAEIDKMREHADAQIEAVELMNERGVISSEESTRRRRKIEEQYEKDVQEFRERAFKAEQAAAIADIIFQGAIASTRAIADYGIPAGLAVAGLTAAATTAQLVSVKSQTPPKFDVGGMVGSSDPQQPDQVQANLLAGEAILDRATVRSLGGEQGIRDLQAGSGQREIVVIQPFKHFDRFVKGAKMNQRSSSGIRGY